MFRKTRSFLTFTLAALAGVLLVEFLFGFPAYRLFRDRAAQAVIRAEIMQREPGLSWMPAGSIADRPFGAWRLSAGVPFDPVSEMTGRDTCDTDFYPGGLLLKMGILEWSYRGCPYLFLRGRMIRALGEEDGNAAFDAILAEQET